MDDDSLKRLLAQYSAIHDVLEQNDRLKTILGERSALQSVLDAEIKKYEEALGAAVRRGRYNVGARPYPT